MMNTFHFLALIPTVLAGCYFPVEYQGMFSTQSSMYGDKFKYSQVTVLPDAIPIWGVCHEMVGANVILHDSTGGLECFRCFHVTMRSPNVIQIYTESLDKCYTNAGTARASCPTDIDIRYQIFEEIMLYKHQSFTRDGKIDRVPCPFSGTYSFSYDINDGMENVSECSHSKSTISNCPNSSELQLRFRDCNVSDPTITMRCMGHWRALDGFNYLALWQTGGISELNRQYRCAMYHVDQDSGQIYLSFSIDSTCYDRLQSPWDGYESMVLTPTEKPPTPAPVHTHSCIFPQWSYGKWKDIKIHKRQMSWRDGERDEVYKSWCLVNNPHGERFSLYSLNQCGVGMFTCVWMKLRDRDVLEYKTASVQYNYFNNSRLCSDDVFIGQKWITEGRVRNAHRNRCPVIGKYVGVIPDDPKLCSRLMSDCDSPALMSYEVMMCNNHSQVLEERKYQCLGQWKEDDVTYTHTYRLDVDTYECFAGYVVNDEQVFIAEAGENCQRNLQPKIIGMRMKRKGTCPREGSIERYKQKSRYNLISTEKAALPSWWPATSRKPWTLTSTQKPLWRKHKPRNVVNSSTSIQRNFLVLIYSITYVIFTFLYT